MEQKITMKIKGTNDSALKRPIRTNQSANMNSDKYVLYFK